MTGTKETSEEYAILEFRITELNQAMVYYDQEILRLKNKINQTFVLSALEELAGLLSRTCARMKKAGNERESIYRKIR